MGYYMRYISSDANDITFAWLDEILRKLDREYSIEHGTGRKLAELRHAGNLYGDIEINRPGDGLFDDEMKELLDGIGRFTAPGKGVVEETLTKARTIVALQVLLQGRDTDSTLERIHPLWEALFKNRRGLLQVDGEGYYRGTDLILALG